MVQDGFHALHSSAKKKKKNSLKLLGRKALFSSLRRLELIYELAESGAVVQQHISNCHFSLGVIAFPRYPAAMQLENTQGSCHSRRCASCRRGQGVDMVGVKCRSGEGCSSCQSSANCPPSFSGLVDVWFR